MSIGNNNGAAYDLSLFEPETKKAAAVKEKPVSEEKAEVNKIIKLDTERSEKTQKRKRNYIKYIGIALLTIAVAVVSSSIVYNNVVINEQNEKILSFNKKLDNLASLEAQYRLKIDSKLTTEKVEEYAENKLGMTKAKSAQKEFIALAEGDQGKVIRGDEKSSIFDQLGKLLHIS